MPKVWEEEGKLLGKDKDGSSKCGHTHKHMHTQTQTRTQTHTQTHAYTHTKIQTNK